MKTTNLGEDKISSALLKGVNEHSFEYFLQVYNTIWISGDISSVWIFAAFFLIIKLGKQKQI